MFEFWKDQGQLGRSGAVFRVSVTGFGIATRTVKLWERVPVVGKRVV